MIELKIGDKVQIDPALVNSKARGFRGIGEVLGVWNGGTCCNVRWQHGTCSQYAHDLVLVAQRKVAVYEN
jgi:hypothetical protein